MNIEIINLKSTDHVLDNIREVWKDLSLGERTGNNKDSFLFVGVKATSFLWSPCGISIFKKIKENFDKTSKIKEGL